MEVYDFWRTGQFAGLAIVLVTFMIYIRRIIGWTASIAWIWMILSGLNLAFAFWNFQEWIPGDLANVKVLTAQASGQALFSLIAIPIAVLFTPASIWIKLLRVYAIAEAVLLLLGWSTVDGYTFSSAMLMCLAPLLWRGRWRYFLPIVIGSSLWNAGATTGMVIWAQVFALIWAHFPEFRKEIATAATASIAGVVGLFLWFGEKFLEPSGRLLMWSDYSSIWWRRHPIMTGIGFGAWERLGPLMQNRTGRHYFLVHNDFLQLTFDTGVIGIALFAAVVATTLWRLQNQRTLFPIALGLVACAMFYCPLHIIATQVLAALMFSESLKMRRAA